MAAKCTCEQLDRIVFPGELLTIHSKVCPAREDELRILLKGLTFGIAHMEEIGEELVESLTRPYQQARIALGESPRPNH